MQSEYLCQVSFHTLSITFCCIQLSSSSGNDCLADSAVPLSRTPMWTASPNYQYLLLSWGVSSRPCLHMLLHVLDCLYSQTQYINFGAGIEGSVCGAPSAVVHRPWIPFECWCDSGCLGYRLFILHTVFSWIQVATLMLQKDRTKGVCLIHQKKNTHLISMGVHKYN